MTSAEAFLARFFGPGNAIDWQWLQSQAGRAARGRLVPFLDHYAAAHADAQAIAVLPRGGADGALRWYVLTRSPAAARQAWDLVDAYLGASYSDLGERSVLSTTDPFDGFVREAFGPHCFSVRVAAKADERETVRARLWQMVAALRAHPRHAAAARPAVGRVLRAFEQALEDRDEAAAESCLDELRRGGQLDAANLAFLEVRRDGTLERWAAMLARPDLLALLDLGVPRKVAALLLQAIFVTELARFEPAADGAGALAHFGAQVEPRYRPLYRTRAGLAGYEVDVQFLLAAAVRGPLAAAQVHELLAQHDPGSPRHQFIASIAGAEPTRAEAPSTSPAARTPASSDEPLLGARRAFEAGDIDAAYAAMAAADASPERAAWMLRWALEMDAPAALTAALAAHDQLPEDARRAAEASRRVRHLLDAARARLGLPAAAALTASGAAAEPPRPVTDWPSWLHRLTLPEEWTGAVAAAAQGEAVWPLDALAEHPDAVASAHASLQAALAPWAVLALHDALPSLVGAWVGRGAVAALRGLYAALTERVLASEIRSIATATSLVRLVGGLLELSQTPATYAALVDRTAGYLQGLEARAARASAIEALEYLADLGCPDAEARRRFAACAERIVLAAPGPLDTLHADVLQLLRRELGSGDAAPGARANAPMPPWATLRGRHVALYSPQEPALERAETLLRTYCPDVQVLPFGDGSGGDALRQAARTADVFVIAWGRAGDSTTSLIADHRPAHRRPLEAPGRGAAALLGAVSKWLGKRGVALATTEAGADPADDRTNSPAVLAEVGLLRNRLEPMLRRFIKRQLMAHLGSRWFKAVQDALPAEQREHVVGLDGNTVLNERLTLGNLISVMHAGWGKYFNVLEAGPPTERVDKASIQVLLGYVNAHREDAHAKPVSESELAAVRLAVGVVERALQRHLAD